MQDQNNKQSQINKPVKWWNRLPYTIIWAVIIGYLTAELQIVKHYIELPIINEYLNWLRHIQEITTLPTGFIGEPLVSFLIVLILVIAMLLPFLGILSIVVHLIKYAIPRLLQLIKVKGPDIQ